MKTHNPDHLISRSTIRYIKTLPSLVPTIFSNKLFVPGSKLPSTPDCRNNYNAGYGIKIKVICRLTPDGSRYSQCRSSQHGIVKVHAGLELCDKKTNLNNYKKCERSRKIFGSDFSFTEHYFVTNNTDSGNKKLI